MTPQPSLIVIYVIIVALFAAVPVLINLLLAYLLANKERHKLMRQLIEKVASDQLVLGELKEILEESRKESFAMPGLARQMMALTVILVLGIAVDRKSVV